MESFIISEKDIKVETLANQNTSEGSVICVFVTLAFITSSFDIVGVVNIARFNFRFSQLMIFLVIIMAFISVLSRGKLRISRRDIYLILWIGFQFFFIFRSPDLKNAIGYFAWLCFDAAAVFSIIYYLNRAYDFHWLMRTYMTSFVYMAVLGIAQFTLYFFDIEFYITQQWSDSLARINGFSYEPSYYATYLLMGFVLYAYLCECGDTSIFSQKKIKTYLLIITTAMVLSSSRMGFLMIIVWIVFRFCVRWGRLVFKGLKRSQVLFLLICMPIIAIAVMGLVFFIINSGMDLTFLVDGLGLFGMSSHSSSNRIEGLMTCLEIFKENPIFGYSLGGVDPMIAQYKGFMYSTLNNGRAMSIIGEVLLASGIVGMVPLILYLKGLLFGNSKLISKYSRKKTVVHMALILALCFELMILCFNQNILRIYVWYHIGILSAGWKESMDFKNE